MTLEGNNYSTNYQNADAFRRFVLYTEAGEHYAEIVSVTPSDDGDIITFTPALPIDSGWDVMDEDDFSFLLKLRLAEDSVTLTHEALHTYIDLSFRTAP